MESQQISTVERALGLATLAWLAFAAWGPAVTQPAGYHAFADQRALSPVPFAIDALSNLAFALTGVAGLRVLRRLPRRRVTNMQRAMAMLLFAGLLLTAGGSAWYQAQPTDATLAADRSGMAVALAGMLGFIVASHVSERAAAALGPTVLLFGAWAANASSENGNLMPWLTLQAGGMALIVWLALLHRRRGAPDVRWSLVIMACAAAKWLDMQDAQIHHFTGGLVSGHALQHIAGALAATPVVAALRALLRERPPWRQPAERRVASRPLGGA